MLKGIRTEYNDSRLLFGTFYFSAHWKFWGFITSDLYVNSSDSKSLSVTELPENENCCCPFIMLSVLAAVDWVGVDVKGNS